MKHPIFVRPLTDAEREAVEVGLRSAEAVTLRRSQIVRASAHGETVPQIACHLHCNEQTVRNAIHAFNRCGPAALTRGSARPHTPQAAFTPAAAEQLRALLPRSPRDFGYPTSLWTLELASEVAPQQGLTPERVTGETIRATRARLGVRWVRAKHRITSPDPAYERKRQRDRLIRRTTRHPDWLLGFEDETWWSRLARPVVHHWTAGDQPLRLGEQAVAPDDPDPPALAGYGVRLPDLDEVGLRFRDGRPVSAVPTVFLEGCCQEAAARDKTALLLVGDNASWHGSKAVRSWLRDHNRAVKQTGQGVRLLRCPPANWPNASVLRWTARITRTSPFPNR
jgi:transposase